MSWHTIAFFGKAALFLFGLGLGFGLGVYVADPTVNHEGNSVDVDVNKLKKGSTLEIKLEKFQNQKDTMEIVKKKMV